MSGNIEYIGTIPREGWNGNSIRAVLRGIDIDWGIFGRETGKSGYHHWQFCLRTSSDLEDWNNRMSVGWHIEKCVSWDKSVRYCRKDGRYFFVGNPPSSERIYKKYRTGRLQLTDIQRNILRSVRAQNDRQVTVWIDECGSSRKSSLLYLEEVGGRWLSVPRTEQTATRLIDFICIHYEGEKCIVIDLPRQKSLTEGLCGVIEDIKDGNLKSAKYQGTKLFVRGIKVLVFTNKYVPKKAYDSLSKDRWDIHIIHKENDTENPTR